LYADGVRAEFGPATKAGHRAIWRGRASLSPWRMGRFALLAGGAVAASVGFPWLGLLLFFLPEGDARLVRELRETDDDRPLVRIVYYRGSRWLGADVGLLDSGPGWVAFQGRRTEWCVATQGDADGDWRARWNNASTGARLRFWRGSTWIEACSLEGRRLDDAVGPSFERPATPVVEILPPNDPDPDPVGRFATPALWTGVVVSQVLAFSVAPEGALLFLLGCGLGEYARRRWRPL
jgi:hypothetical protein